MDTGSMKEHASDSHLSRRRYRISVAGRLDTRFAEGIDGVELGNITSMLGNILPAVKQTSNQVEGEANSSNAEFVAKTVENNVALTIERIRQKSPILKEMEVNGEINIVGGVYHLSTGKVVLL